MGDEPPSRLNPTPNISDDSLTKGQSPAQTVPVTSVHQGQTVNMEFETYLGPQFGMSHYPGAGTLDMSNMVAALPDYRIRQFPHPSFPQHYQSPRPATQSMIYQYHQGAQWAGQTASNYNQSFAQQYPPQYMPVPQSRQQHTPYAPFTGNPRTPTSQPPFQSQGFMLQRPILHRPSSAPYHQQQQQSQQPVQYAQPHGSPAYIAEYNARVAPAYPLPQLHPDRSLVHQQAPNFYQPPIPQAVRKTSSNSSLQMSMLRGPPRKPKQSGHALWVGNLPPATHIIDLKDHFSKDATDDIESVFLISKSNCAFVNYKTEASCAAAMTRFHDSRFQGVRLVCRLRRENTLTTTPGQSVGRQTVEYAEGGEKPQGSRGEAATPTAAGEAEVTAEPEAIEKVKEKFFVVKSLTVEDLERSVQSGIWATQAHNEHALNHAYRAAENVYLIFSANKSGEYYGYARMESAIEDESTAHIDYQPRPEAPEPSPSDLPLIIPTPATATAPPGRIIDDSVRGTIFWEADVENNGKDEQNTEDDGGNVSGEGDGSTSPAAPQTFGKPFKIKWISTERLPFYRTRGLRNPWNANREVKIARDGTEIEPTVGHRLVSMFHRPQVPSASPNAARQPRPPQGPMGEFMFPHGSAPGGMYGTNLLR
ncbi:uncharacterized protein Z518_10561 [Rhinocladiella mackenziei CBS 650.93]|uniref:Rhinocladiella mackenziei CBS 650.93 unplaced genomic scaffold supercont1.9, whole genome shotgun sequence n=1 Tax=Rhinocladiella mackenziei CBS 650.93 TaxID=1442369 RepID=A0A0D2FED8_9EURO|nr:uncharacterized protein Z518_10561 [Rhinocladiella mackenziei CBS 650.93]KIX00422.1 hypothetical protein Z518_10561 [Rhinocladiella mackenziei CBS 650.93]